MSTWKHRRLGIAAQPMGREGHHEAVPRSTSAHFTPAAISRQRLRETRTEQTLSPGALVGDHFRVERHIALGGFGEVWSAEHIHLHTRVALKVLRKETAANQEVVARFAREAFLLGQVRSSHVVRALDFIAESAYGPVIVMEFIEGPSLANVLRSKRLTVEEAVNLGIDLAMALRDLHSTNIVHRDVKPANIILQPLRDGTHRAVFVDLGVSRLMPEENQVDEDRLTEITAIDRAVGTLEYMAPEQILSSRSVTAEADIYALGAILYRAVAGRGLFDELRGAELIQSKLHCDPPPLETGRTDRVAVGLEAVVARALVRKLDDRYEVIDELLTDLSLLRDTIRRTAVRRDRPDPARPQRTPAPEGRRPLRTWKSMEPTLQEALPKLKTWAVRALILALGISLGLVLSLARIRSASQFADGHCRVVRAGGDSRDEQPKGSATRTSWTIVCDE